MSAELNKGVAGATGATVAAVLGGLAHAQGSDKIKVGMLGCGGRGNGAMANCLEADPGVEIIALADLFESQVKSTRDRFQRNEKYKDRFYADVMKMIEEKAKTGSFKAKAPKEHGEVANDVVDLLALLQKSIAAKDKAGHANDAPPRKTRKAAPKKARRSRAA